MQQLQEMRIEQLSIKTFVKTMLISQYLVMKTYLSLSPRNDLEVKFMET